MCAQRILLIEPFYGGSHKQLIDMLIDLFPNVADLHTMSAKKWHWRAITSPLHFAETIPRDHNFRVLFTSSVLPLAELVALRPDLAKLHKIAYFHENQLVYPVQEKKHRYFHHGYNDILTWEHDKDPETFFSAIYRLKDEGEEFSLSVIGETFSEKPKIFEEASTYLKENILNWGYQHSKEDYYRILHSADVVVSTAVHEFFGVSMLEASMLNCYPLCPKRLVYPEIYPDKYLYNTTTQLYKKLKSLCRCPKAARNHKIDVDFSKYSWETMKTQYRKILSEAML